MGLIQFISEENHPPCNPTNSGTEPGPSTWRAFHRSPSRRPSPAKFGNWLGMFVEMT